MTVFFGLEGQYLLKSMDKQGEIKKATSLIFVDYQVDSLGKKCV